jgi:hypothetical protein
MGFLDLPDGRTMGISPREDGVAISAAPGQGICDFCLGPDPIAWTYPCEDFDVGEWGSIGDWGACDTCHHDIQRDNWGVLISRHIVNCLQLRGLIPDHPQVLGDRMTGFIQHRTGEPYRGGAE